MGPVGRAFEADFAASPGSAAPIYTYSLSKGMYAGISLDGKVIVTRNRVNEKFYGREITGQELLNGDIPSPPAARPLYDALHRCHVYAKNNAGGGNNSSLGDDCGFGAAFLDRPKTHIMHGYPELPPDATATFDPYSNDFANHGIGGAPATRHPYHHRRQASEQLDQHSYAEHSYATGVSDITSDPGY